MKFHLRHQPTIGEKVSEESRKLQPELKELVLGRKALFSILSFALGSVLLGNAVWHLSSQTIGFVPTTILGLVLFIVGGLINHAFDK